MRKIMVILPALLLMLAVAPASQASPLLPPVPLAGTADEIVPAHHRAWHRKKKPDRGLHLGWTRGKHKGWSKGRGR